MSTSEFRRIRRKTVSDQPKGQTLVKLGKDNNGRTVYRNKLTGRKQYLDRHMGKYFCMIPAYVFNSFKKPQPSGTRKVKDVLNEADHARMVRLAAKS